MNSPSSDDLILRDSLAADRTALANERTFLAYVRTALAVFAGGVTLVHFFDSGWLKLVGWTFVPAGATTLVFGLVRYLTMRKAILRIQNSATVRDHIG